MLSTQKFLLGISRDNRREKICQRSLKRKRSSGYVEIAEAIWDDRELRYRAGAAAARAGFH